MGRIGSTSSASKTCNESEGCCFFDIINDIKGDAWGGCDNNVLSEDFMIGDQKISPPKGPPKSKQASGVPILKSPTASNPTAKKGMTFGVRKSWARGAIHKSAVTTVGCKDSTGNECNANAGDMNCSAEIPVFCFASLPSQSSPDPTVHQWAHERIKATRPVRGDYFKTIDEVNQACRNFAGNKWRAATFHENPKGWNWSAFGSTDREEGTFTRFWVHIKGQPANCWAN